MSSVKSLLHVLVYDHDLLGSNDLLGETVMSLDHLTDGELHDEWYKLVELHTSGSESAGHLRLEMQMSGVDVSCAISSPVLV